MNRRGFLRTILALGVSPAIVRAESIMRVVPRDWTRLESGVLAPREIYLSETGRDENDGLTWATATHSLTDAVAAIAIGGTIYLSGKVEAARGVVLRDTRVAFATNGRLHLIGESGAENCEFTLPTP